MTFASLSERLVQTLDPALPIYLLIDPLLGEPFLLNATDDENAPLQTQRELFWARPVAVIDIPRSVRLLPSQQPYLIALRDIRDKWLLQSLEHAQFECLAMQADGLAGKGKAGHAIGGWLQSGQELERLAASLAPLMSVRTEMWVPEKYQRLADRRVLSLLRHVIGDQRVGAAMPEVATWTYLCHGEISHVHGRWEEATPWRIKPEEWLRLSKGTAIHRIVAMWLGEEAQQGATNARALSVEKRYDAAFEALRLGQEAAVVWPHRFTQGQDEILWAVLHLLNHALVPVPDALRKFLDDTGCPEDPIEPMRFIIPKVLELLDHSVVSRTC